MVVQPGLCDDSHTMRYNSPSDRIHLVCKRPGVGEEQCRERWSLRVSVSSPLSCLLFAGGMVMPVLSEIRRIKEVLKLNPTALEI